MLLRFLARRSRFVAAAASLLFAALPAARALTPGDIALLGRVNNTTPDTFAFVALTDLPAGTTLYFTDNGWTGSQFRGASATDGDGNEDIYKFTANTTIPAGTIVDSAGTSASFTWTDSGSIPGVSGGTFGELLFAQSGDQIYAFEAAVNNPLLNPTQQIFVLDDTGAFEPATSSNTGDVPPGLTAGLTALTFDYRTGGGFAVKTSVLAATGRSKADWLNVLGDPANWEATDTLPSGTIVVDTGNSGGPPVVSISSPDTEAGETGPDSGTFRITRSGATTGALVVNYTVAGSAANGIDYTPMLTGTVTLPVNASAVDLVITPVDDSALEGDETIVLTLTADPGYTIGTANTATVTILDNDAPPPGALRYIHEIQGSGLASPLVGNIVSIEGIVIGAFPGADGLRGFFVQEEPADEDGDPATSEGIFVFANGTGPAVVPGDVVSVTGTVTEYFDLTELTAVTSVVKTGTAPLPPPTPLTLPFSSTTAPENLEGMLVTLPQTLTVTNTFDLGQYGEIEVSAGGRLPQPTQVALPGAPAQAQLAANNLNRLMIDDGRSPTYPSPTPFLFGGASATEATLRTGDTVTGATGALTYQFGTYALQPVAPLDFARPEPRPAAPNLGRVLKLVGANVLNYFNGNGTGGGFPTSRGADSAAEFARQRAHIIASLTALAPDVVGLIEIENDGYGPTSAIQDLVNGLNAAAPSGIVYAFVDLGGPVGTDQIACALVYKKNSVQLHGAPAINLDQVFNRPPIAQTFRTTNGELFTVCINHFKSKGSAPSSGPNTDQGDGQGAWNLLRTQQADALTAWLATDPTNSGDPDVVILGDLNAYAMEDPIMAIENADYVNLLEAFEGPGGYSYAFQGQFGHLDHALASPTFYTQVTDATTWHNNSDEPPYLDYNLENKNAAQAAVNSGATPWRASDHDPVVIGFRPGRPFRPLP